MHRSIHGFPNFLIVTKFTVSPPSPQTFKSLPLFLWKMIELSQSPVWKVASVTYLFMICKRKYRKVLLHFSENWTSQGDLFLTFIISEFAFNSFMINYYFPSFIFLLKYFYIWFIKYLRKNLFSLGILFLKKKTLEKLNLKFNLFLLLWTKG